jgi:hypothetical protein
MADPAVTYPYETRLNVLYPPLEVIDEKSLSDGCEYKWFNQTLCQVNGWRASTTGTSTPLMTSFSTCWRAGCSSIWRTGRWSWLRGRVLWCRRRRSTGHGLWSGRLC